MHGPLPEADLLAFAVDQDRPRHRVDVHQGLIDLRRDAVIHEISEAARCGGRPPAMTNDRFVELPELGIKQRFRTLCTQVDPGFQQPLFHRAVIHDPEGLLAQRDQ